MCVCSDHGRDLLQEINHVFHSADEENIIMAQSVENHDTNTKNVSSEVKNKTTTIKKICKSICVRKDHRNINKTCKKG